MIELDRLRYDLVHGPPADHASGDHQAHLPRAAPWMAATAGAVLAGYGLTRPRGFWRMALLSAAAGVVFYAWDQNRSLTAVADRAFEAGDEHPLDIAGHGSFPASDPPSLSPMA